MLTRSADFQNSPVDTTSVVSDPSPLFGDAPLFGFYGSGETGPADNDSPPRGVGYHIVICAILGN